MRQLLLAALGVAGALLLNQPAMTQLASETHTFSGEVASTCSINGLNSGYALSSSNIWLSTSYKAFEFNANSAVKLTVRYEVVDEVSGYTPITRYAYLRQRVGGEITDSTLAQFPNTDSAWLFLSVTPGTASVEIAMVIGTLPLPGNYSYRATITCWQ